MIRDAGGLLLVNALFLAAGFGVTAAAGWWRGRGWRRAVGISYLAGVAAYGVAAQLLYVVGAPMARWQIVAVCAALSSGVALAWRGHSVELPRARLPLALALALAAMLALLAVDLWFQPLWSYDSWTFWTPKARALVGLDGLDARWFTSSDLPNRDYPLLLPAVEAAGFRFTGYQQSLLDVQSWLLFVGFVAAVIEVCAARARSLVVWAVLAMIVFAPSLASQLASAEADIPAAVFFACAGLCAFLWLEERSRPGLALAGVFAAGAVATKVEGLIFVVALFAVLTVVVALRSRRDAISTVVCGAAALGVGIVPWRVWLVEHHVSNQASAGRLSNATVDHAGRIPHAAGYLLVKLLDPTAWILLVPFAALATALAFRSGCRRSASFALGTVALSLLGLVFAYWSTPLDFQYHLATSARRVITGPVLFWGALAPLLATTGPPGSEARPEP